MYMILAITKKWSDSLYVQTRNILYNAIRAVTYVRVGILLENTWKLFLHGGIIS